MSVPPCWPLFKPHLQRFLSQASNPTTRNQRTNASQPDAPNAGGMFSSFGSRFGSRRTSQVGVMNIGSPQMVTHNYSGDESSRARNVPQVWNAHAHGWMELSELEKGVDTKEVDVDSEESSPVEGFSPIDGTAAQRTPRQSVLEMRRSGHIGNAM